MLGISQSQMGRWKNNLAQAAIVAVLFVAWETVSRTAIVDSRLLPPFSTIAERIATLLGDTSFLFHLQVTAAEVALACVIVVPIGIGIGLLLNENKCFGAAFKPFFYFLASVPKSVFLPIFILLFGIGFSQKVAFGVFQALFVLVIATVGAASSVPDELIRVARAYGASRWQLYREIYWPSMLPLILEGIRLGLIFNITGVVFAEMYVSRAGVGSRIGYWGQILDIPNLLGGILLIALLSILVNESLRWYERRVGQWRA